MNLMVSTEIPGMDLSEPNPENIGIGFCLPAEMKTGNRCFLENAMPRSNVWS